ncbi:hypothetical protein LguiB_023436 [Lonicera macranthoides]
MPCAKPKMKLRKKKRQAQKEYAKELAKARTEVAHEVKLAKDAEAEMDLHVNKAASKALEHEEMRNQGSPHHATSTGASVRSSGAPSSGKPLGGGYSDAADLPLGSSASNSFDDLGSAASGKMSASSNKKYM